MREFRESLRERESGAPGVSRPLELGGRVALNSGSRYHDRDDPTRLPEATMTRDERRSMPYCIQTGDNGFDVLDRDYTRIETRADLDPELLDDQAVNEHTYDDRGARGVRTWWLYDDGCLPEHNPAHRAEYLNRLEVLGLGAA